MTNPIQSYVHNPHSITSSILRFSSNPEAIASEYIYDIILVWLTNNPYSYSQLYFKI